MLIAFTPINLNSQRSRMQPYADFSKVVVTDKTTCSGGQHPCLNVLLLGRSRIKECYASPRSNSRVGPISLEENICDTIAEKFHYPALQAVCWNYGPSSICQGFLPGDNPIPEG